MIDVGKRVRHKKRDVVGVVIEVDGQTAYIETESGVEMQFAVAELELDAGPIAPPAPVDDSRFRALLAKLPERVLGLAAMAFARTPSNPRNGWATLDAEGRVKWVSKVTEMSVTQLETLIAAGKAGQIEAHAAVAASRAAGAKG